LAADFNASDANIGRNLLQRRLGTEWQGQAATAATEALNRAAAAIAANAVPSTTGRDSSHQYGDSFNAAKNAIQPVPDAGQNSWWGRQADAAGASLNVTFGSTFGVQSDYSKRLAAYRAADQAANDALVRHETTTRTVLTAYQNAITGPAAADGPKAVPGATPHGDAGGPGAGGSGAGTGGRGAAGGQHGADPGAGAAASTPPTLPSTAAPSTAAPSTAAPSTTAPATAAPPTPTTAPAGFAPLNAPGGGSLMPGPSGGFVPTGPGSGAGSPPPSSIPPPLPPLGGGYGGSGGYGGAGPDRHDGPGGARPSGTGYGGAGYGGAGGEHGGAGSGGGRPLSPRGGGLPSGEPAGRFAVGGPSEGAGRAGGPAGMAGGGMGGMGGGMGGHGQEREHRNSVFIPDDEPFRVEFDDVTPSVIGLPDEH
jgi:hypothetical protein